MIDKLKNNKYLSLLGSFAEEIIVEKQKYVIYCLFNYFFLFYFIFFIKIYILKF